MTRPEKTTPIGESPSPHAEARRAFPAGLEQPEGSFRFSVDALLLAAFAASRTTDVTIRFIDLGTGCGVVGLAYLLLKRNICQGFGMDCNPELIAAAQNNTAKLGFSDRFALHTGELADTRFLENLRMEASPVQLVMANPPWRLGRAPDAYPQQRPAEKPYSGIKERSHCSRPQPPHCSKKMDVSPAS